MNTNEDELAVEALSRREAEVEAVRLVREKPIEAESAEIRERIIGVR